MPFRFVSRVTAVLSLGLLGACTALPESGEDASLHTRTQALTTRMPGVLLDINPTTMNASPEELVSVDGRLFFTADDAVTGRELYVSDGTQEGTRLIKDLLPGPKGSVPIQLTWMKGQLYFFASDPGAGSNLNGGIPCDPWRYWNTYCRLWKSDGTEAGTLPVSDVEVAPRFLFERNGALFFTAYDATHGIELWKSDGTAAGTVLVKDISPGSNFDSQIRHLALVNEMLVFFAKSNSTSPGLELWKSDGTEAGTVRVETDLPSTFQAFNASLVSANGALFFSNSNATYGDALFKTDGTAAGTVLVKDPSPGYQSANPYQLTVAGGLIYFTASDDTGGQELWRSDGTAAGTFRVKDIRPGDGLSSNPQSLTAAGSSLYFSADDGVGGRELWKTDGTEAGTVRVKDILPGPDGSSPSALVALDGALFFSASDATHGRELWRTDGTDVGTVRVKDIHPGTFDSAPARLVRSTGQSFFFVAQDTATGRELWKSDGTEAGTQLVRDLAPLPAGSDVTGFTRIGAVSYFAADDGRTGKELWRTDGTPEGTKLLKDIFPGFESSSPRELTVVNGTLFFLVDGPMGPYGSRIHELWKTDGTEAGTVRVQNRFSTSGNPYVSNLHDMATLNGSVLLMVYESQLWKSDGTGAGTVLLTGDSAGGGMYVTRPNPPALLKGALYFPLLASDGGRGLWKTDGTSSGTALVKELQPGAFGTPATALTVVGDTLFFVANATNTDPSIWKSDGTQAGTLPLTPLNSSGSDTYWSPQLVPVNGTLYFVKRGSSFEDELWKSDGTPGGTVRIWPASSESTSGLARIESLTAVGQTLFFVTDGPGTEGRELWKSNGTTPGTARVKNIRPDPQGGAADTLGSPPTALTEVGGLLYFAVGDGSSGEELWSSNGTDSGTVRVSDLRPGSQGSQPRAMSALGDSVLFVADDHAAGREPWVIAPSSVTCPESVRVEATSAAGARAEYGSATPADGVSASTPIRYSHPTGSTFPLGETPVSVTIEDPAYTVRRCSFAVVVSDTTAPTLVCPQSVTLEGTSAEETVTWSPPIATDAVSEVQVSSSMESGSTFRRGTTTKITLTATDATGNKSTCTFTVELPKESPSDEDPLPGCSCGATPSGTSALWPFLLLALLLAASRRKLKEHS